MNELAPELRQQVLQPAMHQKILLRAAELVAMGWTRETSARDANGQKVRSTAPQATAWCVVGAVDRRCTSCCTSMSTTCWASRSTPTTRRRARSRSCAHSGGRSNECSDAAAWRTGMTMPAPVRPRPSGCSGRPPRRYQELGEYPIAGNPLAHQIPAIVPECARAIAREPLPTWQRVWRLLTHRPAPTHLGHHVLVSCFPVFLIPAFPGSSIFHDHTDPQVVTLTT